MYYPSTYEDEVIIAATIIISLLATTVTVVYVHVTANLLYHALVSSLAVLLCYTHKPLCLLICRCRAICICIIFI